MPITLNKMLSEIPGVIYALAAFSIGPYGVNKIGSAISALRSNSQSHKRD